MQHKHYNITVKGRVQGVWFRKYTAGKAKELGLKGFVENKPDGTVYIEVEGGKESLQAFVKWLYKGSPQSEVKSVETEEGTRKNFKDFGVQR